MMKKKSTACENYLEKIPARRPDIVWTSDDRGIVTLEIVNKGAVNRITQKLLKKPKISYIHLDENGSFIWQQIDGERNLVEIGKAVEEHFGEKANPLYERLAKYFQILDSYNFIIWNK